MSLRRFPAALFPLLALNLVVVATAVEADSTSIDQLRADLKSPKAHVRVAAADALGAMGAKAAAAVPDLIANLGDDSFWAALAASESLAGVGAPAVPAVVEVVKSGKEGMRVRALLALRSMGPAASPALPELTKALDDKSPRIRQLAAQAIEEIKADSGKKASAYRQQFQSAAVVPPSEPNLGADWTGFRGPLRDGLCRETGMLREWPAAGPPLLAKWTGLGKGYSSVAIAGGRLFTMGDRGDQGREVQVVLAFDLSTGTELWSTPVGPPHNDGPRCTPTLDGDLLYALGTEGGLVCLEAATGKLRWQRDLVKDFGGQVMTMWKYSESPLIDGDKLICTPGGSNSAMVALDKRTGSTLWQTTLPELGAKGKDGAGYSSAVVCQAAGVRQYVQLTGRGAIGVSADDGHLLWSYNRIANEVANVPSPIVRGDFVFVTTSYKTGSALLKIARKGSGLAAEEVYFVEPSGFENHHGGVVLVGDFLYGGHGLNRGEPTCIHFPTGEIVWKTKPLGRGSAAVSYADGHIVFRYDRGDVFWVAADPHEFRVAGSLKPITSEGPAWAYPVVHDKKLYLRHGDLLGIYGLGSDTPR